MRPLILPWPPSVNGYWANRVVMPRGGRGFVQTFLTEAAKTYRSNVHAAVLERFGAGLKPTRARLLVSIDAFPPDRRARDLDNTLKAALDALTHAGVWVDDEQIDRLEIERFGVSKPGRLEVRISLWNREEVEQRLLRLDQPELLQTDLLTSGKR